VNGLQEDAGACTETDCVRDLGRFAGRYIRKADAWPLNPDGELLLGSIGRQVALANADKNLKVPGIAFAEWVPATWRFRLVWSEWRRSGEYPRMKDARSTVLCACKANHKFS